MGLKACLDSESPSARDGALQFLVYSHTGFPRVKKYANDLMRIVANLSSADCAGEQTKALATSVGALMLASSANYRASASAMLGGNGRAAKRARVMQTNPSSANTDLTTAPLPVVIAEYHGYTYNQNCSVHEPQVAQAPTQARINGWFQLAKLPRSLLFAEYEVKELHSTLPAAQLLKELVQTTATKHRTSYGSTEYKDAPSLEVLSVRSVINPRLQAKYLAKLDDLEGKRRSRGCRPVHALSHLKLPLGMHDLDLNEHILFHGAPTEVLEKICKGGFEPQRGGEASSKLFGVAAYFAANSSKSDDYTEERARPLNRNAKRSLIISRVALGDSFRTTAPMQDASRPPDNPVDKLAFDSVWADCCKNGGCVDHVEVMIYSESQALPIALVDYKHADDCKCAFCCRRPEGQ